MSEQLRRHDVTSASSPAEMQAQIFERLKGSEREQPERIKKLEKFSRQLVEAFGSAFKNLLYHKVKTTAGEAKIEKIAASLQSHTTATPLTVVTDEAEAAHALIRFDKDFAALLSRFLLGGDVDAPLTDTRETLTPSETGLLRIFSEKIIETLRTVTKFDANVVIVANTGLVDLDDLGKVAGVVVPVSISAGSLTGNFDLILRETALNDTESEVHDEDFSPGPSNEEVMKTVMVATASLPLRSITLGDACKIQIGDILYFANGESLDACLVVKNKPAFQGKLGRSGDRYSLQISQPHSSSQTSALNFV